MRSIKRRKRWLFFFGIILVAAFVYLINFNQPGQKNKEVSSGPEQVQKEETAKEEISKYSKILFQRNKGEVVELRVWDIKEKKEKLVFTDFDEDFKIKMTDGAWEDNIITFMTLGNESVGSFWKIKIDGSGKKEELFGQVTPSYFAANSEKVVYVSYDNTKGKYLLLVSNLDGRFKQVILESESIISNPVFIDQKTIAFSQMSQEGGVVLKIGIDGSGKKEILRSPEAILALDYGGGRFAYVKSDNQLYVCNKDGQDEKKITNSGSVNYPVLSNDGSLLAFVKNGKIWLGNSDGSNLKEITDGFRPIEYLK